MLEHWLDVTDVSELCCEILNYECRGAFCNGEVSLLNMSARGDCTLCMLCCSIDNVIETLTLGDSDSE